MNRKLPAYPIFVKDPMFSIWSRTDKPTDSKTMFWTGQQKSCIGVIRADGVSYCFLGSVAGAEVLTASRVDVTLFETVYTYETAKFCLKVSFVSPLPLNNLEVLSNPSCYMSYRIEPKCTVKDVAVILIAEEDNVYNTKDTVKGGVVALNGLEAAYFGRKRQLYLSNSSDMISADWGYMYVCGQAAYYTSESGVRQLLTGGELPAAAIGAEDKSVIAMDSYSSVDTAVSGKIVVAYDEVMPVFYYGDVLKGYYFRNGKTILDAVKEAYDGFGAVMEELCAFETGVRESAQRYGEDYLLILFASYRQSVAAHKLAADKDGQLLFLSKECDSNGCIATVDVSYPSMPLYLLYNPDLVEAMMRPIFKFANMPVWEYDFAPHDAGTYPFCLGQVYGLKPPNQNRYIGDLSDNFKAGGSNYPMFYTYPAGSDIYSYDMQMPVEECGNMLIMSSAVYLIKGKSEVVEANVPLLKRWADYLYAKGAVPENQLCTDDFAGHLDKNINLSIKAAVGLAAYAKVESLHGDTVSAERYLSRAREYAAEIVGAFVGEPHTPLAFDGGSDTFSLKYNLAFDKLLKLGLFPAEFYSREVDKYIKENARYGVPLDSRKSYTKSDWIMWTAALTEEVGKSAELLAPVARYLRESTTRVPFSDWYDTVTGKFLHFRNRTVQGGNFLLLLKDKLQ